MPLLRRLSPVKIFCNATIHTKNVTYYTKHSSKKKLPHLTLAMPQYKAQMNFPLLLNLPLNQMIFFFYWKITHVGTYDLTLHLALARRGSAIGDIVH